MLLSSKLIASEKLGPEGRIGVIMKNWVLPVAVFGLSGLGLLCTSERGRDQLNRFFNRLMEHGDPVGEFGKVVDEQLASIQHALDGLAQALDKSEAGC